MKISTTMIEQVYIYAREIYNNNIEVDQAVKLLVNDYKWAEGSARGYINVYNNIRNGEKYTWTINGNATDYYLKNIYKDDGYNALQIALKSVKLHIDYQENIQTINNIIEIYEKFKNVVNIDKDIQTVFAEIDEYIKNIEPERRDVEYNKLIRNDTHIVRWLKEQFNNRCQFPNCTAKIMTKSGEYYVEVAHITPVAEGGMSTLNNLLVLCPNHHKEFDLGFRNIIKRDNEHIEGELNDQYFNIRFHENI